MAVGPNLEYIYQLIFAYRHNYLLGEDKLVDVVDIFMIIKSNFYMHLKTASSISDAQCGLRGLLYSRSKHPISPTDINRDIVLKRHRDLDKICRLILERDTAPQKYDRFSRCII
jgi:hypothetical protein